MKTSGLLMSTIVAVAICSCSDKNGAQNEVALEGQIVNLEENEGKYIWWMFGDKAYAVDGNKFDVYCGDLTKTEWKKAEKVFTSGHGHNEFGIIALSQDKTGTLYVLDRPFKGDKLLSFTKIPHSASIASIKDQTKWEKYDLMQLPDFFCMGQNFDIISDSTILVLGAPANDLKHVFSIVNFKNQTVTPLSYWPDDDTPENSTFEKMYSYAGDTGMNSNGNGKYLYWNKRGKLAYIFTIDGVKINILTYLYNGHIRVTRTDKHSLESISCCSDNDRIYLLYKDLNSKGEKMEKFDLKDPFPMGNTIEVYDWDGVKQQVIHLDKLGRSIMLSEDSKTIFLNSETMRDDSEPYIYSYDLSSLK